MHLIVRGFRPKAKTFFCYTFAIIICFRGIAVDRKMLIVNCVYGSVFVLLFYCKLLDTFSFVFKIKFDSVAIRTHLCVL
jgi:hypothetical protein